MGDDMGMFSAIQLAVDVHDERTTLVEALRQHLMTGFFHQINDEWIPVCVGIIERYNAGDDDLSYGVAVPNKTIDVPAEKIVDDLQLSPFIESIYD
jgi:hypothetical protein